MIYVVVCGVAFLASTLTFFSGFGLGTLLLPAFALFFAVETAVALTAVVHFLNGTFKLALVWRHVSLPLVWRFGIPAGIGAVGGGVALVWLAKLPAIYEHSLFGHAAAVTPVKLVVGLLLVLFACIEFVPRFRGVSFSPRLIPVGGLLSGFFGGLAGMQGALRSAFLVRAGLAKETFVATGAAIAFLIDVSRLGVYSRLFSSGYSGGDYVLVTAAVLAAWSGAVVGNRLLPKLTLARIQRVVATMLLGIGGGLVAGIL